LSEDVAGKARISKSNAVIDRLIAGLPVVSIERSCGVQVMRCSLWIFMLGGIRCSEGVRKVFFFSELSRHFGGQRVVQSV